MILRKYTGKGFVDWAIRAVYVLISVIFLGAVLRQLWWQPSLRFEGQINTVSIEKLMSKNIKGATILFDTGGGQTGASARLGQYLFDNSVTVVVDRECGSGCAEFFLPAAEKIIFRNDPIIAYHWGPILSEYQMIENGGDTQYCDNKNFELQKSLFEARNLNMEFWRETEKRLELTRYKVIKKKQSMPMENTKLQ